eukprot:g12417.t1
MADDLGYECIGVNGSEYKTPNLDALAAGGVRFTNAFANPICTPSRVKIMTGQYNVRNYLRFGMMPRGETTFAHQLKQVGYATAVAGKWQLGKQLDSPQHFGFDKACLWLHTRKNVREGTKTDSRFANPRLEINGIETDFNNGEYGPQVCADFICDFIEQQKEGPFLVYYPMILTHCPFVPTPDSEDWDPADLGSKTYKGEAKYFGDMVTYMDKIVGQIVDKLDELGLRDNTLILFTGDNGTDKPVVTVMDGREIAGGKGQFNDFGMRVPLIASWPGTIQQGLVTDTLVDFTDMMATICDVTGAPMPSAAESVTSHQFFKLAEEGHFHDDAYVIRNNRFVAKLKEGVRHPDSQNTGGLVMLQATPEVIASWQLRLQTSSNTRPVIAIKHYADDGVSLFPSLIGASRHKPWMYFWYRDQVMARNATYSLIVQQDGSKMRFLEYTGPYDAQEREIDALTAEQQKVYDRLQAVIDEMAKTRPARLKKGKP